MHYQIDIKAHSLKIIASSEKQAKEIASKLTIADLGITPIITNVQ